MSNGNQTNDIKLIIETQDGVQFECFVPPNIKLSQVLLDLYEEQGWPTTDNRGRGVRAVADLVDPQNPERTKRLNSDLTADGAGLFDGAILRVFSESIAGVVDERERVRALIADHREMEELAAWNTHIKFEANTSHAPTQYIVTFDYNGFKGLSSDGHTPETSNFHQVEITMGAEYPRNAPKVKWLTPVFHPNISPETGAVCLGVIMDRYMPGLGLARLVTMLAEMVQYRNFDQFNALNRSAAEWAVNPAHFESIKKIGGSPFQGPIQELFKEIESLRGENKPNRIQFHRIRREGIYNDR